MAVRRELVIDEVQPRRDFLFVDIAEELFEFLPAEQPADRLIVHFPFKAFLSCKEVLDFPDRFVCLMHNREW